MMDEQEQEQEALKKLEAEHQISKVVWEQALKDGIPATEVLALVESFF